MLLPTVLVDRVQCPDPSPGGEGLGHAVAEGLVDTVARAAAPLLPEAPPAMAAGSPRLRLVRCQLERHRGARSCVTVAFEEPAGGGVLEASQEGATCPGGDLRLAALATLDALAKGVGGRLRFDLIGVKPMRAFDTNLMLVAVVVRDGERSTKVLGVAVDEDNQVLATTRATLHAVNRLVSPILGPLPIGG